MIRNAALCALAISAATAAFAQGAAAQTVPPAAAGEALSLPFGPVPQEIHGVACETRAGDANFAPSLTCRPKDVMGQPSIHVTIAPWRDGATQADLVATVREAFHERTIFNVIREERFAPPADPDAVGFRALYQPRSATVMSGRFSATAGCCASSPHCSHPPISGP